MWYQVISMALGLWLMAVPTVLGYGREAATMDHIVGPLVATFACIAIWEATRPVRWTNLPLGLSLVIAPWWLHDSLEGKIHSTLIGLAIALLSCLGGVVRRQIGGGWSALWQR